MPDASPHESEDVPDFESLYEDDFARGARMTPRMAYWLWHACIYLADTWRDGRDDPGPLLESLPRIAQPLAHAEWYDRFVDCFEHLATSIAVGEGAQEKLATCTGEEMALHLAIDLAEAFVADGLLGPDVGAASGLPDHGEDDGDFETMRSVLFTDHDVLMLYDASIDGIEDEDGKAWKVARYANLHPRDWFKPFALS